MKSITLFAILASASFQLSSLPASAANQETSDNILERAEGVLERLKDDLKGELQDLREDLREEVAYLYGMESYVYGPK